MRPVRAGRSGRAGRGFGLVEVLVSLAVVGIGLLGVAKMQALGTGQARTASSRSLAATLAASMAAGMQVNRPYWAAAEVPSSVVVSAGVISEPALDELAPDCRSRDCSPPEMAAWDLREWNTALTTLLPAGSGQVACTPQPPLPTSCIVTVRWSERQFALSASDAAPGSQTPLQEFSLHVQP